MRMRIVPGLAALVAVMGCESSRVQWGEPQAVPGDTLGALAVGPDGSLAFAVPTTPEAWPVDSTICEGSLVAASEGSDLYAAWLKRRPDSTVAVVASRLDARTGWTPPAMVDSVDVGQLGCNRPGPSIAVAGGYVHVAYSLKAPEGYGVFFAHSMDRAGSFHWPMIVVYGDRLSETSTAAHGMQVAIAYEEPSGRRRQVGVALSKTQGHTFEPREPGSPDDMVATRPRIALRDSIVALSFSTADGSARAARVGQIP